ncbi:hypothetical protein CQJ38_02505 [Bacillus velezensis]|nr:hypothetical protein CQJ38_02505 [Bacillus velezensis]MBW7975447.1 hypothetical protein [Bacillus velezensis]QCC34936.1 hypothetical protein E4T61_02700 [Bacillus velezensis]
MKKFLYKHLILTLISSVLFLFVYYLALRTTTVSIPITSYQYYLAIYFYIIFGYLTIGLILSFITDKLGYIWKLKKYSLIIFKLLIYLLLSYAISDSLFVLIAPLIYLLFESFLFINKKKTTH